MKLIAAVAAAGLASLVSAQVNNVTNAFGCPLVNGSFCAGENIIIRCTNGVAQPDNCDDNLAGYAPLGVNYSPCFDCSVATDRDGRAACSKNGVVYPDTGAGLGSTPFAANASAGVCFGTMNSTTSGAPYPNGTYSNGTNPGGPVMTATGTPTHGVAPTGYGAPSSASITPAAYTGAASSVETMGTGAALGFGAIFAALGML